MIGGFEEPTTGAIFLGDRDVVGLPPYKRDVNTVFQSYALFPHLTIARTSRSGCAASGSKGEPPGPRLARCLELVGLAGSRSASRGSSPAGSSSASRSRARSSTGRGSCCSTSRSAPST